MRVLSCPHIYIYIYLTIGMSLLLYTCRREQPDNKLTGEKAMSLRLEPEGGTYHKGEDCLFCLRWERIIAATAASDDPKVRSWKDWEEAAYRKHLEEKA